MYPDMVRDFLGRTAVGKEGGIKMTNAHSIIWIKECNLHRKPVFGKFNTLYRACVGVKTLALGAENVDHRGTDVVSEKVHYLPTAYLGEKS